MLSTLPPVTSAGFMVTENPFDRDTWTKDRILLHSLGSNLASTRKMSTSSKEGTPLRKRESRSGMRKVSALSAEQLERKRANDREAQRSIRQRTKEHIEQLESHVAMLQSQVAELQPQGDRFTELLQRNASLEEEVVRLKRQVAALMGRPDLSGTGDSAAFRASWALGDAQPNAASNASTGAMLSPHFSGSSQPPRATSAVSNSAPNRSPHAHDWQSYPSTRSPSLGCSSNPDFAGRMDPYVMEGHLNQGSRLMPPNIPVAPQISFGNASTSNLQTPEPSFAQVPSQRLMAMTMPPVSPAQGATVQPYHSSTPSFQDPSAQPSQRNQGYSYDPWGPQS